MVNLQTVNCEHVWREISNYIEGEVDAGLQAAMDEHFRTCKKCASVLAGTQNVIRLYGDERMMEAPAGFGRRLEKRLAQNARPRSRWLSLEMWLIPVAAVALIAVGLRLTSSLEHERERSQMEQNRERAAKNIAPDMTVLVTADSKIFHVAGCSFIHGKEVKSLTAKQALDQGYAPCTRCLRKYLQASAAGRRIPAGSEEADLDADEQEVHKGNR